MSNKILESYVKKLYTRNYMTKGRDIPKGVKFSEFIPIEFQNVFKSFRAENCPKFNNTISRFRKTHTPSTARRYALIEKKKTNYYDQAKFITSYIIGQKVYKEKIDILEDIQVIQYY